MVFRTRLLLLLLLLTWTASARSVIAPKTAVYASANGQYHLTVVPGSAGRPCRATLHRGTAEAKVEVWSGQLANPAAPRQALVDDQGRWVVTVGDWAKVKSARELAIYDAQGRLIREYRLEQLLDETEIEQLETYYGWAEATWFSGEEDFVVMTPPATLVINLRSGQVGRAGEKELRAALVRFAEDPPLAILDQAIEERWTDLPRSTLPPASMNPEARLRWAVLLAMQGNSEARQLVIRTSGPESTKPGLRADMLAYLPLLIGRQAEPALLAAFDDDPWSAPAQGAVRGFARLGTEAVPTLLRTLEGPGSPYPRMWAAKALGEIGAPQALPLLLKCVEDPNSRVRDGALAACFKFAENEAAPGLAALLKKGTEEDYTLIRYFERARYQPVIPVLMEAWKSRGKEADRALTFQTGVRLGPHKERWESYFDSKEPARFRLRYGDAGGVLAQIEAGELGPSETRELLASQPRLVNVFKVAGARLQSRGSRFFDSDLNAYDVSTGALVARSAVPAERRRDAVVSPDGERILLTPQDSAPLQVMEPNGRVVLSLAPEFKVLKSGWCGPDIVALTGEGKAHLWDLTGKELQDFSMPGAETLAASSDGIYLALQSKEVSVWKTSQAEPIYQGLPYQAERVYLADWGGRGQILSVDTDEATGFIYPDGRRAILLPLGESFECDIFDVLAGSEQALVGGERTVEVKNFAGETVGQPATFARKPVFGGFTGDGSAYLASDGISVEHYSLAGEPLARWLLPQDDEVRYRDSGFALSGDGRYLLAVDELGTARLWDTQPIPTAEDLEYCARWFGWSLEHGRPMTLEEFTAEK